MLKLAYLVTHPIQYQAPLLKRIAREPEIDLTVFFRSDFSLSGHIDTQFGTNISWDVPLVDGYKHDFLPVLGKNAPIGLIRPINYGLQHRLTKGRCACNRAA